MDFGDAPDSYGTLLGSDGARHGTVGPTLGGGRDCDDEAAAPLDGTGDDVTETDDEDGVTLPPGLIARLDAAATVTASEAALLDGWVDFNRDGTFDAAEQIAANVPLNAGANMVRFAVPADVVAGASFARFRLSSSGGLGPTGAASDGEVEDHAVNLLVLAADSCTLVTDPLNAAQQALVCLGTAGDDLIQFSFPRGGQSVAPRINGIGRGKFAGNQVARIVALGLEGNDRITGTVRNDHFDGGPGNDTLTGAMGNDWLVGGPGDDSLGSGGGNDRIDGGAGNDSIKAGLGNDTAFGGAHDDSIEASDGDDQLNGGSGNDTLAAGFGNDVVRGGDDDDSIRGSLGNDILLGEAGNDRIDGSDGFDVVIAGEGSDTVASGLEDDILIGGTTAHDADDAALAAILAEWTALRAYATRVSNLRDGSGGGPPLNPPFFLAKGTTVFDDGVADRLHGSAELDWFFQFAGDVVDDLRAGEIVD